MKTNDPRGLVIEAASECDVPAIRDFIRKLAEFEKLSHEMHATEEDLRRHLFGERPAAEAILAKFDGRAVGFALFFTTYSTFSGKPGIWLEDLFVLEAHRGSGIGGSLMSAVAKIAVERNAGQLEWTVLDWNERAIGLYRKLGAKPMSDWTTQRLSGEALVGLSQSK